jgi:hypothetical protein
MSNQDKEHSEWPYGSLLLIGFFGTNSPDGRKLAVRSFLTLLLFIAGFAGVHLFENAALTYVSAALMPLSILLIVYSYVLYLKSLDTLERLIQLTAFAATYGAVLVLAISIYALNLVICCPVPVILILLAEPIRGICLYLISKSYV